MAFSVAANDVEILGNIVKNPSGNVDPGQSVILTIVVGNIEVLESSIDEVTVSSSNLVNGVNTIQVSQIQTLNNIGNGTNQSTTLTIAIPTTSLPGTYSGTITARDTNGQGQGQSVISTKAYSITINSKANFEVNDSKSKLSSIALNAEPGDEIVKTFTLTNTGNINLVNIALSTQFSDLIDENDNEARFSVSPTSIPTLNIGESFTFTITADTDSGFEISKLTGNLIITPQGRSAINIPLSLDVNPNKCNINAVSSGISVSIDTPDDDDDFSLEDNLNINVEVDNSANDDKRIRTKLVVYNLDTSKRLFSDIQEKRVDDDSSETFTFNIDLKEFDLNDGDELGIFVKSFERGKEDEKCDDDEISAELIIPAHNVAFESVNLNPTSVNCGETVTLSGVLKNIGSNSEDVTLKVANTNLGILQYSPAYNLGTSTSNKEQFVNLNFNVPTNLVAGNYVLDVYTLYGTTTTSVQKTLTISNCGITASQVTTGSINVNTGNSQLPITGSSVVEKSLFEKFNSTGSTIPTSVWVLANILLVILIMLALVFVFRRRH